MKSPTLSTGWPARSVCRTRNNSASQPLSVVDSRCLFSDGAAHGGSWGRALASPIRASKLDVYAQQAHNGSMPATKDSRMAVRLSSEQDALIRHAAEVEGTTVTDFTVAATIEHARDVLADRRAFSLDEAAWSEFLAVLDRPVQHKPRLATLLSEPSIFDDDA